MNGLEQLIKNKNRCRSGAAVLKGKMDKGGGAAVLKEQRG